MTQFDATARINVDLSAFSRAASQAGTATGAWTTATNQLQSSLTRVENTSKKNAAAQQRTLNLYRQLASSVSTYATGIGKLNSNNEKASKSQKNFNTALTGLATSLSRVEGLSKKEAERLGRTVTLYQRLASAVNSYASAMQKMASINQRAQQIQQAETKETNRAAEADRKLTVATERNRIAAGNLALAQQKLAAAQAKAAQSTQQLTTAQTQLSTSSFALRSTLGELEQMYRAIIKALFAIPAAVAAAAISQEKAFAQVERVVGSADAATYKLYQGLQKLSTDLPISFEATARIAQLGAQIGITSDQLIEFTRVVSSFSITTGIGEEQVTLLLGRIAEMQDVPVTEYENLASAVLALGTASAATEEEILRVNESIATVSNVFGLTTQATVGLSSALATLRVRPELSRGSLTRVFGQLEDAIAGSGAKLEKLGAIMSLTTDEVIQLRESDPDAFFLRFIEGLKNAESSGVSFRGALRELGIGAVRDIDTVSRLANNYDVLSDSFNMAYAEYAKGTELQRQSQGIFDTTAARVGNLSDAFQNFLANAGKPLALVIGALARTGAELLDLANSVPVVGIAFGGLATAVTLGGSAFLLYRLALVKALTGIVALREAQKQLGVTSISLKTILQQQAISQQQLATSAASAAAAQTSAAVANRGVATAMATTQTATRGASLANGALSVTAAGATAAQRLQASQAATTATATGGLTNATFLSSQALQRQAVTAATAAGAQRQVQVSSATTAASMTGQAVATNAATLATTRMGLAARAATLLMGPWGLAITAVVTAAAFLIPGLMNAQTETEKLSQKSIEAAGGVGELARAIAADTAAAKEGGVVYRELSVTKATLTDATRKEAEENIRSAKAQKDNIKLIHGSVAGLKEQAKGTGTVAEAAKGYLAQIANANKTIESNTQLLKENNVVLGEQARKWVETAFDAAAAESQITRNTDAVKALADSGIDVGDILEDALSRPEEAGKKLRQAIHDIEVQMRELSPQYALNGLIDSKELYSLQQAKTFLEALSASTGELGDTAAATAVKNELLGTQMEKSPAQADLAKKGFTSVAEALSVVSEEGEEADKELDEVSKTLQGFGGPLDAFKTAWDTAMNSTKDDAKESANALTAFTDAAKLSLNSYIKELDKIIEAQRNWARNILILTARLGPDIANDLAKLGPEAAPMLQKFVDASDAELKQLKPRLQATTKGATDAMAATIIGAVPKLRGASTETVKVITDALVNQLAAGKVPFADTLNQFAELVTALNQVKGEPTVDLKTSDAKLSLAEIQKLISGANSDGSLDPTGTADIEVNPFDRDLAYLGKSVKDTEHSGVLNPKGTASLNPDPFLKDMGVLSEKGKEWRKQIEKYMLPKPRVSQSAFNTDLANMRTRSRSTGDTIQANLTRTATVTVGYTYRENNSKPSTAYVKDGGWISGPGGPRDDKVPAMLSDGEFVINAAAARRNAALVEAINGSGSTMSAETVSALGTGTQTAAQGSASRDTPERARALTSAAPGVEARTIINVTNHYPQAEATSTTVNRSLAFAANLDGTI